MTSFACIITAAGRGERLGAGLPKALLPLAGEPMLTHAVRGMATVPGVIRIVVSAPPQHLDETAAAVALADPAVPVEVVAGGSERSDSVAHALAAIPPQISGILVHDAARPFVPTSVTEAVMAAVAGGADAVVPGLPVTDTIKQIDGNGVVVATPDRASLRAVQTPQGFRADVLRAAHSQPTGDATDDASLVERLGGSVIVVPGHPDGIKITTPADLPVVEQILASRR